MVEIIYHTKIFHHALGFRSKIYNDVAYISSDINFDKVGSYAVQIS